jgi:hypothetical protein
MARTNTRTQGSKTGPATPVHGTSSTDASLGDKTAATGTPKKVLEDRSPTNLDDSPPIKHHLTDVETVEEDDEEEPNKNREAELASLSDLDEALSDGASSYGDEPALDGSPDLKDLIRLGQEHCRAPCTLTNNEGVKTASVCGKTVVECARHAETRLGQGRSGQGKYRYAIGTYSKVPVSRGYTGHGIAPPQGFYFTDEQLHGFKQAEMAEMSHLVQGMNDDVTDKEEMNELARDLRVKFADPSTELPRSKKASPQKGSSEYLRKALAADSGSRMPKAPAPELWFGMIHTKRGDKWVTPNLTEATTATTEKGCRMEHIFKNQGEAEAWLTGDDESDNDEDIPGLTPRHGQPPYESDDSSDPGSDCNRSGRRKLARRQAKKQAQKARKRQAAREAVKSSGHKSEKKKPQKSSSSRGGKKKPQKSGRSSKKQTRHKSNYSSDPSSSSSSGSESDSEDDSNDSSSTSSGESDEESKSSSSDNSSTEDRRSSRHKKKSKKAKKARKPRPKTDGFHKYQNDDPSTGDSQRVYGMSINGTKIDKEVAPDKMRRADQVSMYTAAVDVTSLPGGWNSNKGVSEEMFSESQKIVQLTASILASSNKARGMEIQDTSWNSTIRHSLGKMKNREDVFEFVKKLGKSKKSAFRQEGNLIQHFLYQRQYAGTYIREYSRSSLLTRLTSKSFTYFFSLGDAIRQLAYNHPNWEGGPAKAMLTFHSEKLLEIRLFAVSRKQLILQIYSYLRDAHAKDFYHESMSGALWERIGDLSMAAPGANNGGGGGGNNAGDGTTRCGWCNNKDLHKLLNLPGQKSQCPFKNLTEKSKAREGAKWVVDEKRTTPAKDVQELLATALSQFA